MVSLKIGNEEWRDTSSVSEKWVTQQLNGRRDDGACACIRVKVETDYVRLHLATPDCASSPGGCRPPTSDERAVFDLWERLHLNREGCPPGNLIAFLKQLERLLR